VTCAAGFGLFLLLTLWLVYADKPAPFQLGVDALTRWERQVCCDVTLTRIHDGLAACRKRY